LEFLNEADLVQVVTLTWETKDIGYHSTF